jgi:UDP-glucose 4-epimerase
VKLLVTGGCGYIGSNLCNMLAENHEVTALDYHTEQEFFLHPAVKVINGDACNFNCTVRYDHIFHLAAIPRIPTSFSSPANVIANNTQSTLQVLEIARHIECSTTFVSSSSVYSNPFLNPYSYSKWMSEQHCRLYHELYSVEVSICRLFNVYGENHPCKAPKACVVGLFEAQKKTENILHVCGDGTQKRDFTHVLDVCEGLKATIKLKGFRIVDLGFGKNYSVYDLAKMFEPQKIDFLPARKGEGHDTLANTTTTNQHILWNPKRSLPNYVKDFLRLKCTTIH